MGNHIDSTIFFNQLFNIFWKKIIIPSSFKDQYEAIQTMLKDDLSGLVDSLTDFAVNSAVVDFGIETDNDSFSSILKKWSLEVNKDYKGLIPPGIKALSKEYFQERWKGASFPVLKIASWSMIEGVLLPNKLFFVNGGDIVAKDKSLDNKLSLLSYDYYLGIDVNEDLKLDKSVIISRPYGRWFDKYPLPFLIKRGIYHNFKIIEALKNMGKQVLEEVIPSLYLIKKGNDALTQQGKTYSDPEFQKVFEDLQELLREHKENIGSRDAQSKIRVTDYAEEWKHLIPDLSTVFTPKIYEQAERNILGGLGFIDIVQGVSDNRRESILNPKAFIEEVRMGVEDFKGILFQLMLMIIDKNTSHKKYTNVPFYITASPIRAFQTDTFKQELRLLWKHGQLSDQTYCELVGEVEFRTEISRRKKESKEGTDFVMYPHLVDNVEGKGIDIPEEITQDTQALDENGNPISDDKINNPEKYVKASDLETAPYNKIKDLPEYLQKLSEEKKNRWMKVFNNAYRYKLELTNNIKTAETYAFRVANGIIKRMK